MYYAKKSHHKKWTANLLFLYYMPVTMPIFLKIRAGLSDPDREKNARLGSRAENRRALETRSWNCRAGLKKPDLKNCRAVSHIIKNSYNF